MSGQASTPTYNPRNDAGEKRPLVSIGVSSNREFGMSLTHQPSRAEGRALSHMATWTARAAALAVLASLLAACHTTRVVWAKPGANAASLRDDTQACEYRPPEAALPNQTAAMPATSAYAASSTTPGYFGNTTRSVTIDVPDTRRSTVTCLIAHGWRLTPLP